MPYPFKFSPAVLHSNSHLTFFAAKHEHIKTSMVESTKGPFTYKLRPSSTSKRCRPLRGARRGVQASRGCLPKVGCRLKSDGSCEATSYFDCLATRI